MHQSTTLKGLFTIEFHIMDTVILLLTVLGTALTETNEDGTSLRFYYRSMDHYSDLPLEDASNIFSLNWYTKTKDTVFFAHGFTGTPNGPAVTAVINAYIENGNYNVILLNWEYLAAVRQHNIAGSYLNWAAPNARKLGIRFGDVLLNMTMSGLNLNTTHLVGHSLGAQVFGIAGNHLIKYDLYVPWITGLDPASISFENRPLATRLHAGSAVFVDIVHSDPNKYGYKRSHGTVDFWPNYNARGPIRQPGCSDHSNPMFSPEDLCNHNRCWQLWIDTLKYPEATQGRYAKSYRAWKNSVATEDNSTILALGKYEKDAKRGDYYFVTKDSSPYGLGQDGLQE